MDPTEVQLIHVQKFKKKKKKKKKRYKTVLPVKLSIYNNVCPNYAYSKF